MGKHNQGKKKKVAAKNAPAVTKVFERRRKKQASGADQEEVIDVGSDSQPESGPLEKRGRWELPADKGEYEAGRWDIEDEQQPSGRHQTKAAELPGLWHAERSRQPAEEQLAQWEPISDSESGGRSQSPAAARADGKHSPAGANSLKSLRDPLSQRNGAVGSAEQDAFRGKNSNARVIAERTAAGVSLRSGKKSPYFSTGKAASIQGNRSNPLTGEPAHSENGRREQQSLESAEQAPGRTAGIDANIPTGLAMDAAADNRTNAGMSVDRPSDNRYRRKQACGGANAAAAVPTEQGSEMQLSEEEARPAWMTANPASSTGKQASQSSAEAIDSSPECSGDGRAAAHCAATLPPGASSRELASIEKEIARLAGLKDEQLVNELPGLGSPESLALIEPEQRIQRICDAVAAKSASTQLFRDTLESKSKRIREQKRAAAATQTALPAPLLRPEKKAGKGQQEAVSPRRAPPARVSNDNSPSHRNMRIALWEPPASPFFLIEEVLFNDPWKLLVACMLLNKTTGRAVRKILWRLFQLAPTAEAGAMADVAKVEEIIKPLGLFRKRAVMFRRFSQEYLNKEWVDPQELYGIGRYAADAYYMFCRNQWREREAPLDKDLLEYYNWLKSTGGEGTGLEREKFEAPTCSGSSLSAAGPPAGSPAKGAVSKAQDVSKPPARSSRIVCSSSGCVIDVD